MNKEKEVVLITGANGLVAKKLAEMLETDFTIKFLTRKPVCENEFEWNIEKQFIDLNAIKNVNHIVHLAGAGIADKRWSKKRKKEIIDSRVKSSDLIFKSLLANNSKITSFISASAIGYYGTINSEKTFDESSPKGNDFLSSVCFKWEQVLQKYAKHDVCKKNIILRIGVVLSNKGGALTKIIKPIRLNFGAVLGSGNQYMPWIHINDLCNLIKFAIEQKNINGIYNATAPEHTTNKKITQLLALIYKKRIWLPNIPNWFVKLIFGESSILLLNGSKVSSKKIIDSGFVFKFPKLKSALLNLK